MVQITNKAMGPRGFAVKSGRESKDDKSSATQHIVLRPGETAEVDLHDEKHPVIQGMLDAGEIEFGAVSADSKKPSQPVVPNFDQMTDEGLKAYVESRMGDKKIEGKVDRPVLLAKAKELAGAK